MLNTNLSGKIGQDAVIRQVNGTQGPISVANFSVAAKGSRKGADGKPEVIWVDCSLWGSRADNLAQYLTKGTSVALSGEPGVNAFMGNDQTVKGSLTLNVATIDLLGGGQNVGQAAPAGYNQPQQAAPAGYNQPQQAAPAGYNQPQQAAPAGYGQVPQYQG